MANRPYPSFLLYKDASGQFRWRCQSSNYKTIADSSEGYHNVKDCEHGVALPESPHPIWETEEVSQSRR